MVMAKTAQLVIRLDPEIKERLEAFSQKVGVPMSTLINAKIREMLKTGKVELAAVSNVDEEIEKLIGPAF